MHQASVGFQCPECVAEGAKGTRSARTAYGGLRSTNPGATTITLIAINVFVWITIVATGWKGSQLIDWLALSPLGTCFTADGGGYWPDLTEATCTAPGMEFVPGVADGSYWQLLTSMFAHVEMWHIAFNMVALYALGPQLELVLGRARFLALYLLSGLAGSTLVYWLAGEHSATLGASGAVFGLMGALLVVAFKVGGNLQSLLTWIGVNVVITVIGAQFISWQAHLGGLVGGVVIAAALVYAPRQSRTQFQVGALVVLAALLALAVIVRTAVLTA
ncbi:rhomboid family intramembrane serine protease [Nocardioides sp. cx-169]|uniref:rhomboid family intramembrane serine protease n=1 Tax=Nocardioides sp. cx-169 TaxID=2899080 RepID=UPI001E48732D|nr:rhomboid family intramembrane serine protease [Nocardioides sp. cx-169]MCD4533089.1 rhomboid family intramembrane serine protease [Nocardioides sp. cx-169]